MKKKSLSILITMIMLGSCVFALAACDKTDGDDMTEAQVITEAAETDETTEATETDETTEASEDGAAWETFDSYNEMIDGDDKDRFTEAMKELDGVDYTPISVVATQVVAGTNYAYLAAGETVNATKSTDYYIVVIYADLNGNNTITSINKIDPTDIKSKEISDSMVVGGWATEGTGKLYMLPDGDAQESFDQAVSSEESLLFNPLALVAVQNTDAGKHYKAIVFGKTNDEAATTRLYVVQWFNNELEELKCFDLESYISN